MPSVNIFKNLLSEENMEVLGCYFSGAITSGRTTLAIVSFEKPKEDNDKSKKVGYPACEILYSDVAECRPTITGLVRCAAGFALIDKLSYQLDLKEMSYINIRQSMETFILKIKDEIPDWAAKFNQMNKISINKSKAATLIEKSSKMLPSRISNLENNKMDAILDEIANMKSKNDSLWDRRSYSKFLGRALELII